VPHPIALAESELEGLLNRKVLGGERKAHLQCLHLISRDYDCGDRLFPVWTALPVAYYYSQKALLSEVAFSGFFSRYSLCLYLIIIQGVLTEANSLRADHDVVSFEPFVYYDITDHTKAFILLMVYLIVIWYILLR